MPFAVIEGGLSAKNAIEIPGLTVDQDGVQRVVIKAMDFDTTDLMCNIAPALRKYVGEDYEGDGSEIIDYNDLDNGDIELVFGAAVAKADVADVVAHAEYIRVNYAA